VVTSGFNFNFYCDLDLSSVCNKTEFRFVNLKSFEHVTAFFSPPISIIISQSDYESVVSSFALVFDL
jgi:hypothetical protein